MIFKWWFCSVKLILQLCFFLSKCFLPFALFLNGGSSQEVQITLGKLASHLNLKVVMDRSMFNLCSS